MLVAYRAASCAGVVLSARSTRRSSSARRSTPLIRHKLQVVGVANGQRVPEDWHRLSAQRAGAAGDARRRQRRLALRRRRHEPGLRRAAARGAAAAAARMSRAAFDDLADCRHDRSHRHAIAASDQADGLRRMFAGAAPALRARGLEPARRLRRRAARAPLHRASPSAARSTLVVDAAERAGPAGEMALIDLGAVHRAAVAAGRLPRRARPADPLRRCAPARPRGFLRARRRGGAAGSTSSSSMRSAPRAVPPVRAAPRRRGRGRRAVPDRPRRRPARQRHPCLCGDEAARAARRPAGRHDLLLGAAPQLAARRAHRQPAGELRRQLLRRACCATGPGSTRPATPREPTGLAPAPARRRIASRSRCR